MHLSALVSRCSDVCISMDRLTQLYTDTFMSKTARLYQDTRAATAGSNLDRLNDDLQDVTRIMTKNMEELLWRGDSLDSRFFRRVLDIVQVTKPFVSRDVALVKFTSHRVRKVPECCTQHQFPSPFATICSIGSHTFCCNHSHLVEIYMTFRSDFIYIFARVPHS